MSIFCLAIGQHGGFKKWRPYYSLSSFLRYFLKKETTVGMGAEKTRRPPINENDDQQPGLELVTLSPKAGRASIYTKMPYSRNPAVINYMYPQNFCATTRQTSSKTVKLASNQFNFFIKPTRQSVKLTRFVVKLVHSRGFWPF